MKKNTENKRNTKNSNLIDSVRFSIRISPKSVTSVSLKKNITSLWLLLAGVDIDKPEDCRIRVTDFMYENLNKWKSKTAKGFSDFITESMIRQILEDIDFVKYKKIKNVL